MPSRCEAVSPLVIAVAGEAGSGKSTLGRALAERLRLPLLDLDTLTTGLLDRLHGPVFDQHWLAPSHGRVVREARYEALRATARDVVDTAGGAVLVAPFTSELAGGAEWDRLRAAVAPAEPRMLILHGSAELFARRRSDRRAERDAHRADVRSTARPTVPHVAVAAELTVEQQVFRVCRALGRRCELDPSSPVFTGSFDAVLFDLDGVLADSTASVARSWARFAAEWGAVASTAEVDHGRPARASVERVLPRELVERGMRRIEELEVSDAAQVAAVPGAPELIGALPGDRRAVVTSGSRRVATARLDAVGITPPAVLVTADDGDRGKPDPDPYLAAASRLDVHPRRCLVLEDSPAGVAAARAAGCSVVGVLGTVAGEELAVDLLVDGLDRLQVRNGPGGVCVRPVERPADL